MIIKATFHASASYRSRPRPPVWPAARRCPGAPGWTGPAPLLGGTGARATAALELTVPREFYMLNGWTDTSAARTSPMSLRTTA
jgi:hypothetical protein